MYAAVHAGGAFRREKRPSWSHRSENPISVGRYCLAHGSFARAPMTEKAASSVADNEFEHPSAAARRECLQPLCWLAVLCLLSLALGCEPKLVVGSWSCEGAQDDDSDDGGVPPTTAPVETPWSTGFENGFCDYRALSGRCFAGRGASSETVTAPVHSGKFAAAFGLNTTPGADGTQARCFLQSQLPSAAYYAAFFFIPSAPPRPRIGT